jgi:hypothetical protein
MAFRLNGVAAAWKIILPPIAWVMLSLLCACGRPPADNVSNSADSQKLPFDRQPRATGISPSQSLIPSSTKLPEGTAIPVRLQTALSSASSHSGDSFRAILDAPVVLDGQTVVAGGTSANGRVLEAKAATNSPMNTVEPGYLRLVLVSLNVGGRTVAIETSSIFAKGGVREERSSASGTTSGGRRADRAKSRDVEFGVDRHLSFRLAQTVDLQ